MSAPRRLEPLDALRGMAVAAMILVNHPGNWSAVYPPLVHAPGDGLTFADLIFPCFIVITGITLPWTLDRQRRQGARGTAIARRIAVRMLTLIAIGLVLNAVMVWPTLTALRIPGVLQRIAVTYALAAWIVWRWTVGRQLATAVALLVVSWMLLAWLPSWIAIDRAVFGAHALTATGDPEGLLGLMSSVATALLGAVAGCWLARPASQPDRVTGLVAGAVMAIGLGLLWSRVLPFNKAMWSGSFALVATGLSLLALAACLVLVDGLKLRAWSRPFVWLGANPLAIYALSELVGHLLDCPWLRRGGAFVGVKDSIVWRGLAPLVGDAGGMRSSLLYAVLYASLWLGVAAVLQRRGIALRA